MSLQTPRSTKTNVPVSTQSNPLQTPSSGTNTQTAKPSLQTFDGWTSLPQDISLQLMYWLMLKSKSASGPASLVNTSKKFQQDGQAFRANSLYKSAQSALLHTDLVQSSRRQLNQLTHRSEFLSPKTLDEVTNFLGQRFAEKSKSTVYMNLDHLQNKTLSDPYVQQALRHCPNDTLALFCQTDIKIHQLVSEIGQTLPSRVDVALYFAGLNDGVEFTKLLINACTREHISSMTFYDVEDLLAEPDARQALINLLCHEGMVSCVFGDFLKSNYLLQDLTERFQEIRHTRLISLNLTEPPTLDELEALVAAIDVRHASGKSRITVVVNIRDLQINYPGSSLCDSEEKLRLEDFGLFFGRLSGSFYGKPLFDKVYRSVGEGPVDDCSYPANPSQPCIEAMGQEEASEDSDVVVGASEEESSADVTFDDFESEIEETAEVSSSPEIRADRRQLDLSHLPRLVKPKRDRCVVS